MKITTKSASFLRIQHYFLNWVRGRETTDVLRNWQVPEKALQNRRTTRAKTTRADWEDCVMSTFSQMRDAEGNEAGKTDIKTLGPLTDHL